MSTFDIYNFLFPFVQTIMETKTLTLVAKVSGLPRPEVEWFRNNKPVSMLPNHRPVYEDETCTLKVVKVTMDQAGEYKCVATNSAGTADCTANITIEGVMEAPEITRELPNREVREGRPVKLDCAVKGIPEPEVTW